MTAERSRRVGEREGARTGSHGAAATEAPIGRTYANVWCGKRLAQALISVVERRGQTGSLRYVQWCSLIGIELDCDEHCLAALDAGATEGGGDTGGSPDANQAPETPSRPARSPGR